MPEEVFTTDDLKSAEDFPTLGPAYYAARRASEAFFAGSETEPFKKVVAKVVDDLRDQLYDYVEAHILGDLENNIQLHVRRMVERTVQALLTGNEWAMNQYPLSKYHDGEEIRATVCKHGGDTILSMRIAELEAKLERLRKALENERSYR